MRLQATFSEENVTHKPITSEIGYEISNPTGLSISPDGNLVVYGVSKPDKKLGISQNSLWIKNLNVPESPNRELTNGSSDVNPKFSPDGSSVAFLRVDSEGKNQIWILLMSGGEAAMVTSLRESVRDFSWKPDSTGFAAVSDVDPEYKDQSDADEIEVVSVTRIRYRHDELRWRGNSVTQIFEVDIATKESKQLTYDDGDQGMPSWSPDGSKLAFISDAIPERDFHAQNEVRVMEVHSGKTECWSKGIADACSVSWLPDGKSLAIIGSEDIRLHSYYQGSVYVLSSNSSPIKVTDDRVAPIGGSHPAKNGSPMQIDENGVILFTGQSKGESHIYKAKLGETGQEKIITLGGQLAACEFDTLRKTFVCIYSTPERPPEIFQGNFPGETLRMISNLNGSYFSGRAVGKTEKFSITRSGLAIESILLYPAKFDSSKKYPLVVNIHGGPHGLFSNSFDITRQLLSSKEYLVLAVNPRGTSTYGKDYMRRVLGDWGGEDYNDIMASLDHVCEQNYVDPEKLAVTGYSYGGFMSSWIIGHTNRFKCAVIGAPVTNLASFYGTADIGVNFSERQMGGSRLDIKNEYDFRSPLTYAENVDTPALLMHGDSDYRVPISQSEEYFVTLKRLGKIVEFVRFPGQNHGLMRTGDLKMRKEYLTRMLQWIDRYT
ncbi:MAG: hypothetical protein CL765_07475 [Chloroflexi bacterium]|nr:hypothetical protein [Chloroflexota bacterium]|tara:strand:- start:1993 stop:3975 length:1983 start_codon:yes stop_codon:yes gene_type:complete